MWTVSPISRLNRDMHKTCMTSLRNLLEKKITQKDSDIWVKLVKKNGISKTFHLTNTSKRNSKQQLYLGLFPMACVCSYWIHKVKQNVSFVRRFWKEFGNLWSWEKKNVTPSLLQFTDAVLSTVLIFGNFWSCSVATMTPETVEWLPGQCEPKGKLLHPSGQYSKVFVSSPAVPRCDCLRRCWLHWIWVAHSVQYSRGYAGRGGVSPAISYPRCVCVCVCV